MIASQYHRRFTGLVHFKLYLLLYINYILNFHITIIIWQIKIFEYYLSKLSSSSSPSEAVVHCCPRPHSFRFSCVLPEDRDRNDDNWVERSPWWKPWSCTACTAGIGGGSCGSHRSWCPADSSSPWVRMGGRWWWWKCWMFLKSAWNSFKRKSWDSFWGSSPRRMIFSLLHFKYVFN